MQQSRVGFVPRLVLALPVFCSLCPWTGGRGAEQICHTAIERRGNRHSYEHRQGCAGVHSCRRSSRRHPVRLPLLCCGSALVNCVVRPNVFWLASPRFEHRGGDASSRGRAGPRCLEVLEGELTVEGCSFKSEVGSAVMAADGGSVVRLLSCDLDAWTTPVVCSRCSSSLLQRACRFRWHEAHMPLQPR